MWNMWTSNCYWNMVMFSLHTSALMKVWLSTVKVLQGKATISCWLNWLGSCEWEAFTSTYHMGWHCVKRRQTPFLTGQPKGCSDRTAIMTKCVVVVRSRRAQKQTNKKQHTIRVVWIWYNMITFDNCDFKVISRWCCPNVLAAQKSNAPCMHVGRTNFMSVEGLCFMGPGGSCYGCQLLEFVAARISRIHFVQRYVISKYGVRITFVLFTPVPETGCPMWHAGLTLALTFIVAIRYKQNLSKHHSNNVMSSIFCIVFFFPHLFFPQEVWSRRPFYWATSRQNDFLRSQSLRARAQYVPQHRMCTCSKFSEHNFINPIFFPCRDWVSVS